MLYRTIVKEFLRTFRSYSTIPPQNILKLDERGFWNARIPTNCTKFIKLLTTTPQTIYSGFDPTADSLHVGNLIILVALLHCQRAGHKTIALIGEATASIGDPSDKKTERSLLELELIQNNVLSLKNTIVNIFNNHNEYFVKNDKKITRELIPLQILNNKAWYGNMKAVDFFDEVGRNVRMGTLLRRQMLKKRLDDNLPFSLAEFTYQVLQAYDWLHLFKEYDCKVQIGGADQLGNMQVGFDLIDKDMKEETLGLTMPLLTTKAGEKFGKSEGNAIWLSPKKTSPYEFHEYFLRTKDSEVEKLLNFLTFIPVSTIRQIMDAHRLNPSAKNAQRRLAKNVTLLVHGESGLESANNTRAFLSGNKSAIANMTEDDIIAVLKNSEISNIIYDPEINVFDLAMKSGLFTSEEQAIDMIVNGHFHVNFSSLTTPGMIVYPGLHILPSKLSVVSLDSNVPHIIKWLD